MRSLQRFLGLTVDITKELDPMYLNALAQNARRILELVGYNPDEYLVYIHQLVIQSTKKSHFGIVSTIQDRIDHIDLIFAVNQKQQKDHSIKFYNHLTDSLYSDDIRSIGMSNKITYSISGKYLEKNSGFRNELITFVKRNLRIDHRKIKISIQAYPTERFIEKIKKDTDSHLTQFDFRLNNSITLGLVDKQNESQPKKLKPIDQVVTIDRSEARVTINVENGGIVNMSNDEINVHDVIGPVTIKSRLEHVTQTINNAQSIPNNDRVELSKLIKELQNALTPAEKEQPQDAERVVKTAEMVADEVTKEKPSKPFLEIALAGLTEAAKAVQTIAPTVIPLVGKIVQFVGGLF